MRIEEKMKNAKTTSWLTKGLTKEEVKDIVEKARKKGKREMEKMGGKTEQVKAKNNGTDN